MQNLGIHFEIEKVLDLAIEGVVTGEMIAEVALEDKRNQNNLLLEPYRKNEKRSDNPYVNFYWDFCSQGKPAYVSVQFIGLNEAIQLIRKARGIAVLAHPGINIGQDQKILEGIVACGVDIDFHGKTKPAIKLGSMSCHEEIDIYHQFKKKLYEVAP